MGCHSLEVCSRHLEEGFSPPQALLVSQSSQEKGYVAAVGWNGVVQLLEDLKFALFQHLWRRKRQFMGELSIMQKKSILSPKFSSTLHRESRQSEGAKRGRQDARGKHLVTKPHPKFPLAGPTVGNLRRLVGSLQSSGRVQHSPPKCVDRGQTHSLSVLGSLKDVNARTPSANREHPAP